MALLGINALVFRQFWALCRKNWIVLSKHKLLNGLRCFVLPIAYGIFLGVAQVFLIKPNHYGLGTPAPILSLADVFDPTLALIWADGTTPSPSGATHPSPSDIMTLITQSLHPSHRASVRQVASPDDIAPACPQNFNLFSECFAAVAFTSIPVPSNASTAGASAPPVSKSTSAAVPLSTNPLAAPPNGTDVLPPATLLNYTIRADAGLGFVDVIGHGSDFERRILPLQWAIDSAIIQLQSGAATPPTPLEWPFSMETDEEQSLDIRLSYIRGLRTLLVIALFINFLGVAYHLPGAYATERSAGLTAHMRAMGLKDLPRVVSWHASLSLVYLPAWVLTAVLWKFRIFSGTSVGTMIVVHLLTGLSLASYTLLPTLPRLPPSLSASTATFLSIILAVLALVFARASTTAACIFVLIFPPGFYVFCIRAIAGFEVHQIPTDILKRDPDNGLILLPLIIVALVDIFLYPCLVVWLERIFYDAHDPPSSAKRPRFSLGRHRVQEHPGPSDQVLRGREHERDGDSPAIIVTNLSKTFRTSVIPSFLRPWRLFSRLRKSGAGSHATLADSDPNTVTAIQDLSFTVPRGGIFVLLGSNGAGKSTALGVLAGLVGRSGGLVEFPHGSSGNMGASKAGQVGSGDNKEGGSIQAEGKGSNAVLDLHNPARPPKGSLGIVPQRNVLFPELTCMQTMRLWSAVKRRGARGAQRGGDDITTRVHEEQNDAELAQLLVDCGLAGKVNANAGSLSGGQKRKLQLAIGLVGGSEIVLVDECTSGVDPLSRRSIWRTLTAVKAERTIVFTTHFLDEADLLADNIAILAAPGKLVAEGSPVSLKSRLGKGYTLRVTFGDKAGGQAHTSELLTRIQDIASDAVISSSSSNGSAYSLHSKDSKVVAQVLETLQAEKARFGLAGYEIHSTSIEDIFLDLMAQEVGLETDETPSKPASQGSDAQTASGPQELRLTSGRKQNPLAQSLTIFYKRGLITRRSWLSPLLTVLIAVAGACIPLFFMNHRAETCTTTFRPTPTIPLYLGNSPYSSLVSLLLPGGEALISPPGLASTLGLSLLKIPVESIPDNGTFVTTVQQNFRNLSLGGISIDLNTGNTLLAWEATPPGFTGPTLLNLASNVLYNQALNASGRAASEPSIINANYQSFPAVDAGTLVALKWIAFFGATMGVFPAFFALYVSLERRSSVQAMQLSNGLTNPAGLWLGHLLYDGVFGMLLSTIIIIVFAVASNQFHGLGYFWLVLVLYGLAAALFSYCVSLLTASPLAAFAAVAGYQVIMFILYLSGYLLTITYAKNSKAAGIITIIHFTVSILSPVASVLRAALVSVNLFSLLCDNGQFSTTSLGDIKKFGGPIAYLIVEGLVFFAILVYVDSGSVLPRWLQFTRPPSREASTVGALLAAKDVADETEAVEATSTDLLRVLHVSKTFDRSPSKAVDDVSFGVSRDTVFAMLGPNGAGKTSTFNIIRGDIYPDSGDVYINGTSIIAHPNTARLSLGVCPQFTAIDPQLTVRQHLNIYGLLKGLRSGVELRQNVDVLLRATTLSQYADRLASKLSGGNQRKLSFAIALIGNPTVILIDEYSTGIDAATKRSMWITFRRMAIGKAVVITTHSMEEASALANKVGIIAGRMLAVGDTGTLAGRYALYEVHFPARTREEVVKAQQLMARIPESRMADDVATRFEVPIQTGRAAGPEQISPTLGSSLSLAQLFETLSEQNDFPEYTIERISLESVFLKVIREHNIQEEDTIAQMRSRAKKSKWRVC